MARKIVVQSGDKVSEGSTFKLNPFDILIPANTGRHFPPTDQAIQELADSFAVVGQLEPIVCRSTEAKEPELIIGHCRVAAGKLLREGYTNAEGDFVQNENFVLEARVIDCSDAGSLAMSLHENIVRNDLSHAEIAFKVHELSQPPYNYNGKEIAKIINKDGGQVSRYLTLFKPETGLSEEGFKKLHTGEWSLSYAWQECNTDPEIRAAVDEKIKEISKGENPSVPELMKAKKIVVKEMEKQAKKNAQNAATQSTSTAESANDEEGTDTPPSDFSPSETSTGTYDDDAQPPTVPTTAPVVRKRQLQVVEIKEAYERWMEREECTRPFLTMLYGHITGEVSEEDAFDAVVGLACREEPDAIPEPDEEEFD